MVLQRTDLGKKGNGETEKLKGFNGSQQSNQFREPKYEQNYKPPTFERRHPLSRATNESSSVVFKVVLQSSSMKIKPVATSKVSQ